jgi:hypothetical protein
MDQLSNSSYMGTDESGAPLPTFQEANSTCHVPDQLTVAPPPPPTVIKKILSTCKPLVLQVLVAMAVGGLVASNNHGDGMMIESYNWFIVFFSPAL